MTARRAVLTSMLALMTAVSSSPVAATATAACPRCAWRAPASTTTVTVATVDELQRAIRRVAPRTIIELSDGEYRLTRTIDIATPHVTLRGRGGHASKVVLRGAGMLERQVGVGLSVSAADVTIADVTIGQLGFHGIQVRGERGASRATIHGVRIVDTGQQLIKASTAGGPLYADSGLVSCSTLEYSDHAPSDYTNGIDVLAGNGWTVRHNTLRQIRGPKAQNWAAGPAILFWANSKFTQVERNRVLDSYRGIAFGLGPGGSGRFARDGEPRVDHRGGAVRHNVVINEHGWADEGIEASAAGDVEIVGNTVAVNGRLPWSISLRFPETTGIVRGNRTNRGVVLRNGARADIRENVLQIFGPQRP